MKCDKVKGKVIYVDVDGTLCTQVKDGDYRKARPKVGVIRHVNELYKNNTIIIWTARGTTTGMDWEELTKKQLRMWEVMHDGLIMNKPYYDYFVCDKSLHPRNLK